jgi:DNA-binding MarR family transcriptional regulator
LVKKLDEMEPPSLIDHIGWRLWRLSRHWKAEFEGEMTASGYGWMTQVQGEVVSHLRHKGVPQSELASVLGISKQAVQQHVDSLVELAVVERVPDPRDGRGRIVRLTKKGVEALAEGNRIKASIEQRYRSSLGSARFDEMTRSLDDLFEVVSRGDAGS